MKKKFTFLMTAMALILAMMGPRNVAWGQETATITFANQTSGTGDGSTAYTTSNFVSNGIASSDAAFGTITCSATEKCYSGKIDHGLKAGASSSAGSFTISFSSLSNVSKIVLNRASYNNSKTATITVKNGETTLANAVSTPSGTDAFSDMVIDNLNITSLSTLTVNTSKYCYIKSITITYSSGTTPTVAAPTFTPSAGTYTEAQDVTIACETEGASIYYTSDGTTPTAESTPYSTPIQLTVPSTTTIKAIAVDGEGNSSNVASATYTLMRTQYTPEQLLEEVTPTSSGVEATVIFDNHEITDIFVTQSGYRNGIYLDIEGDEDFYVYCRDVPETWEVGGKVSGNITGNWTLYNSTKEFCPEDWEGFSYSKTTQLPAPTNLTVSDLSMNGATLSWNAVEHASSYTVYVTDADEYEETYTNITENSKVLNDLNAGTEYMWTVQAIGDGVTYLNSGIAEGEVFETPTTVLYDVIFETQQTGGTIEIDKTQAEAGEEVTANATAADHFSFTQWNFSPAVTISEGEINDNAISFIMPASDVTVTATFTEDTKYTVTYLKGGEDVEGDDPETVSYYVNDVVILEENPYTRTGFTFNGWQVKDAEENDVTVDEGMFEMPASNVTVTATWAEKTPATITLKDKGAQYGGTINGYVGDNLLATLAAAGVVNPTGLEAMPDYEFAGWAQSKNTETPNIASVETTITGNATLYAIYANIIPGTTTYQKVNSLSDIVAGRWVIVNDGYALPSTTTGSSNPPVKSDAFKVTVTDNQISSTVSANMIWNFAISEGKATITNSGNDYLYATDNNNGLRISTTEDTWTFETNSPGFAMKDSSKSRYCATFKTGSDWRSYTSKNHSNYGDSGILYLYKENTTPGSTIYDFEESAKTLTVTYEANGADGEVPTESQLFGEGDEYTLASAEGLTKEHHTFAGWKASTDEQTYAVGTTYTFGEASVTFTAQWSEDTKYTVFYYVNGTLDKSEDVFAGEIQLTAPANVPNGYSYVGWTTTPIEGVAQSATYFSSYNVTGNVHLYAVFAIAEGGGDAIYAKVTEEPDDWSGDYLLVYEGENDAVAWTGADESNCYVEVTIANGEIAGTEGAAVLTIAPMDGGYSIQVNEGRYIGQDKYDNGIKFSNDAQLNTISLDDNNAVITAEGANNQRPTMRYNKTSGQDRFRYYKSGQQSVQLYKYSAPSTTYSNFCTSVTALSGNLAEAITEANTAYYISGAATVEGEVTINGVLGNADASLLVINDGGQLIHNNAGVAATFQKNITAYADAEGNDGYYLIANPTDNTTVANLVNENGYDLYTFNGAAELEWINMKSSPVVANDGIGYLYANSSNVILGFAGEIIPAGSTDINLNYANKEFGGFNLIGNPFACNAYVGKSFYVIEGTELVLSENNYVAPCEGFFVEATEADQSVTISTTAPEAPASLLSLNVSQNRGKAIDRAIVNFDSRSNLHKFMMNPNHTNISLAKNGEEFAAISTAAEGEMPVNFKAEKNGTYTITVNTKNVDAEYLHLIDNMTGMDVDLLSTPSYTFEAKTSDYASRFKLVFGVNNTASESSDSNFAFMSDGNLVIDNIEGEATLQIVDELGRVISTETVSGSYNKALNLKAGLYIINLNGMTQKIVVE